MPTRIIVTSWLPRFHADDEKTRIKGGSCENDGQAALVVRIVERLLKCGVCTGDVGIMAPYTAQVNLLVEKLKAAGMQVARGVNDPNANGGGGLVSTAKYFL